MIKLYGDNLRISPFVFSAYATLKEKGIEFEYHPVALENGETESDSFRRLSPTRLVPVLQVGDLVVSEATAIIEYLEEQYPEHKSIYPAKPADKAKARMLCAWLRSSIQTLRDERSAETIFYPETRPRKPLSESARYQADILFELAQSFLQESKTENLFGEYSVADFDLTFALERLLSNGDPVPPRLRDYVQQQMTQPTLKEYFSLKRAPFKPYF
jgi:glutathione S-transferase